MSAGWKVVRVSALDSPAFTGEPVPDAVRRSLVTKDWVDELVRDWGEGSPMYLSRVLAQFPEAREDAEIDPAWIMRAQALSKGGSVHGALGLDVARHGADKTVAYSVMGGQVRLLWARRGDDLMQTTGRLAAELGSLHSPTTRFRVVIDAAGLGGGVVDRAREQGLPVAAFVGASRARKDAQFVNRRAEAFWMLREALRDGKLDLDPADTELADELAALRFLYDSKGRIQIESKADMRLRGVKSPDRADALSMALTAGGWEYVSPEKVEAKRKADELQRIYRAHAAYREFDRWHDGREPTWEEREALNRGEAIGFTSGLMDREF